jgi:hypothetical protein
MASAPASIADDREIVVIGSQSVLGQFSRAPQVLLASMEADVFPRNRPERADLINGAIGQGSRSHEQFGYYAQGVGKATVILPEGWRDRLVRIKNANTGGSVGLCLEVNDLAISKYAAGRARDLALTAALARNRMTDRTILLERDDRTRLDAALRDLVRGPIARDFAKRRER